MRRLVLAVVLTIAAVPVIAQQTPVVVPEGAQVAVDRGGQLRAPTALEQLALAASSTPRPTVMLRPVINANGVASIAIGDAFDHAFVVRTAADGSLNIVCTDDHEAAREFLASTASIDTVLRVHQPALRRIAAERE